MQQTEDILQMELHQSNTSSIYYDGIERGAGIQQQCGQTVHYFNVVPQNIPVTKIQLNGEGRKRGNGQHH